MTPESRDYKLVSKIAEALESSLDSIVHIKCFNLDEVNMLQRLIPDHLKSRIQYTYMEFYTSEHVKVL
jgi:hypothetical protein